MRQLLADLLRRAAGRLDPNPKPSGDLVIQMNGKEYARVVGPEIRNWLITTAGGRGRIL